MTEYPWGGRSDALPEQVNVALAAGMPVTVLDVRTPAEYATRHIPGAASVPMDTLPNAIQDLDPDTTYIVVCEHGVRSKACTAWLMQQGLKVVNMVGGMSSYRGLTEAGTG